jgi:hypothetical protein
MILEDQKNAHLCLLYDPFIETSSLSFLKYIPHVTYEIES